MHSFEHTVLNTLACLVATSYERSEVVDSSLHVKGEMGNAMWEEGKNVTAF